MRDAFFCACVLCFAAIPAMAQEAPKYELFFGYGLVRVEGGQANLNGWHASFAPNLNDWFGVAIELSGQYGTQTLAAGATQVKTKVDFHSLGFGPRLTYRRNVRFSPFAHALFGMARGNWRGPASVAGEETSFAYAFGGGIDTKLRKNLSWRIIQAECVRTHFSKDCLNNFRMATGLLISF